MSMLNVVVGIDGSAEGERALKFAINLAARDHARIDVCFVTHQPNTFGASIPPVNFDELANNLEQHVKEESAAADVSSSFFHRDGDIASELKRLADERSADVIAVGQSRHPHLHLGSVPKRLLDTQGHAILIVP